MNRILLRGLGLNFPRSLPGSRQKTWHFHNEHLKKSDAKRVKYNEEVHEQVRAMQEFKTKLLEWLCYDLISSLEHEIISSRIN